MKIHLLGPSGSGTSTIGKALAEVLNISHFESDEILWEETPVPFSRKRPVEDRRRILATLLQSPSTWVLSGSAIDWGEGILESVDRIILLYAPWDIRKKRLIQRERQRFGDRISPGGDMEEIHQSFLDWASRYDTGGMEIRSKTSEETWLSEARCPVLSIDNLDQESTLYNILLWLEQEGHAEPDAWV